VWQHRQQIPVGAPMGISELERRVVELGALVKCQLRLIKNLEKRSKDLTSAKVVLYSLRVRFFLAAQEWHRVRCYGDLETNFHYRRGNRRRVFM
jgi:hypothetical protein